MRIGSSRICVEGWIPTSRSVRCTIILPTHWYISTVETELRISLLANLRLHSLPLIHSLMSTTAGEVETNVVGLAN